MGARLRRINYFVLTATVVVAMVSVFGLLTFLFRTVARWVGVGLLTHIFHGHVTGWMGETFYWIAGAAATLGVVVWAVAWSDSSADRVTSGGGGSGITSMLLGRPLQVVREHSRAMEVLPPMQAPEDLKYPWGPHGPGAGGEFPGDRDATPLPAASPGPAPAAGHKPSHKIDRVRPRSANYVNFAVLDATETPQRPLELHEGLYARVEYNLVVRMGLKPDVRFKAGKQKELDRPREEEDVTLDVVLALAENLAVLTDWWTTLEWPPYGPSVKNAEFRISAQMAGRSRVKVLAYFEHDLLFCGDLEFEVRSEGDDWAAGERPIQWKSLDREAAQGLSLFKRFDNLDHEARRGVNISVHRRTEDMWDLLFFLRGADAGSAIYPLSVEISAQEITAFLARTRSALGMLSDNGRAANPDNYTVDKFLDDMSLVGSELWSKLFGSEMGRRMAGILEERLRLDGTIVQVWSDSDASDFVLPWVWIYPLRVAAGKRQQTEYRKFWGYRFVIEQVRQTSREPRPAPSMERRPLKMAGALHNFPAAGEEREFFASYGKRYANRLSWAEVKAADWGTFLPNCDAQILYFYCHGQTAQPLSRLDTEMLERLRRVPAQSQAETDAWITSLNTEQRRKIRGQSAIEIEKEVISLADLGRFKPIDSSGAPVVFLNMCESAEFYPGATDNLVDVFLRRGARGVIGTEVPIPPAFGDELARRFFKSFFAAEKNGDGREIGRVLWDLRRGFLDEGNPMGFMYTYFGDSTTRLRPAIVEGESEGAETRAQGAIPGN